MSDELLEVREFSRTCAFEDLSIRSDGDGRTVDAYAAVFNTKAEIRDKDGHYYETLAPGSFTKTLAERGNNFSVFYNHGLTIHGTPDGALSVPIGVPISVRADDHGVFTSTRYLDNPLADSILDGIKQGAIRGQSFGGKWIKSSRSRPARAGDLPLIYRSEVAMKEYGPTPAPFYVEAAILGTRSVSSFLDEVARLDPEDMDRLRAMFGIATPLEPATPEGTSTEAAQHEEPAESHSALQIRFNFRAQCAERGL